MPWKSKHDRYIHNTYIYIYIYIYIINIIYWWYNLHIFHVSHYSWIDGRPPNLAKKSKVFDHGTFEAAGPPITWNILEQPPHFFFACLGWVLWWEDLSYPLVNVYKKLWKDPPCSMGKLTISTGPFSIAMLNYQRVSRSFSTHLQNLTKSKHANYLKAVHDESVWIPKNTIAYFRVYVTCIEWLTGYQHICIVKTRTSSVCGHLKEVFHHYIWIIYTYPLVN